MQSHLTFSLKSKGKIVISVILTVIILGGCRRKEQTVFTDTVYATGSSGYSVTHSSEGEISSDGKSAESTGQDADGTGSSEEESPGTSGMICVFVCGAVNCEGVYELPGDARVIDAVRAAGGYTEDADTSYVNQAEYVYDTQRIEIPTREEAEELREAGLSGSEDSSGGSSQEDGRIDLNSADKQTLMMLPGIGESKAERIIEYRQAHGRFGATEELMNVSGIGSGVYEKMKDWITVK